MHSFMPQLKRRIKTLSQFLKEIFVEFSKDSCVRLGAALAYYTVFALAPIIIIVMMLTGAILGEQTMHDAIFDQIRGLIGERAAGQVQIMVEATTQRQSSGIAGIISLFSLVFAASGVFYVIKDSLNIIWKVKAVPKSGIVKFAKDRLRSLAIVVSLGFIMLVSLVLNGAIAGLSSYLGRLIPGLAVYLLEAVNFSTSYLITTVLFATIFKTLPDVRNEWSDVWIGAAVTALLLTLGKYLISLYIGRTEIASTYGAAGAIVIILLWVYFASQILFLGAEFTFVYSRRYGSGIRPSEHAVRVVQREVELDDEGRRRSVTDR